MDAETARGTMNAFADGVRQHEGAPPEAAAVLSRLPELDAVLASIHDQVQCLAPAIVAQHGAAAGVPTPSDLLLLAQRALPRVIADWSASLQSVKQGNTMAYVRVVAARIIARLVGMLPNGALLALASQCTSCVLQLAATPDALREGASSSLDWAALTARALGTVVRGNADSLAAVMHAEAAAQTAAAGSDGALACCAAAMHAFAAPRGSSRTLPALVINLDGREDRMRIFGEQAALLQHVISPQRLRAVDGAAQDARALPLTMRVRAVIASGIKTSHADVDSLGAVGCSLSHAKAWERIRDDDTFAGGAFIFEDDVAMDVHGMTELCLALMETAPLARPDYLMLGWHTRPTESAAGGGEEPPIFLGTHHRAVYLPMRPWPLGDLRTGSHAYFLSRRAAVQLLTHALPLDLAVDAYIQAALTVASEDARESSSLGAPLRIGTVRVTSIIFCGSDIAHPPVDRGALLTNAGTDRVAKARAALEAHAELQKTKASAAPSPLHLGILPAALAFTRMLQGKNVDAQAPLRSSVARATAALPRQPHEREAPLASL